MNRPKWFLKVVHMAVTTALIVSMMTLAFVPPVLADDEVTITRIWVDDDTLCCCDYVEVTAEFTYTGSGGEVTNVVPSIIGLQNMDKVSGPDLSGFSLNETDSQNVTWTLHCNRPGDGKFTVRAEWVPPTGGSDSISMAGPTITQEAADLVLTIIDWPNKGDKNLDKKVCYCEEFDIVFNITNTGNCTAWGVGVTNDITPPTKAELLDVVGLPADIPPGENVTVTATLHCTGYGNTWIHFVPVGFHCPDISREFQGESDAITIVQQKVHLLVDLDAPEKVCFNDTFNVTLNITNIGNIEALDVTPILGMSPIDGANCTPGLNPENANIPAGESVIFNWTCNCTSLGEVEFSVIDVTGYMEGLPDAACDGKEIPQDNIEYPDPVTVTQLKAHLLVDLDVPEEICYGANFTVAANVTNTGTAGAINVTPTLTKDPDYAGCTGPAPASANISPDEMVTFEWNCNCTAMGVMTVNVTVNGTDNCTLEPIPEDNIEQADPVNVTQEKVHLNVGLDIDPTELCWCDNFTVNVTVNNTGNIEALNVTPVLTKNPDAANCTGGGPFPSSANISANSSQLFTWNCHCINDGEMEVSVNMTGQMGGVCNGTDIPVENIILPASINVTQYKVHLNVTDMHIIPLEVCPCQNMTLQVTVKNTGNVVAKNVWPTATWTPFELMEICSGPIPDQSFNRDIQPGEELEFAWCLHCLEQGNVNVTVNFTGQMGGVCGNKDIPVENIYLWPDQPITVYQKEAVLNVTLEAPDEVCYCDNFTVTANITNIGQENATDVTPWLTLNPVYAEYLSGPNPPMADIAVNETAFFNWTYHCNSTGTMNISINATGLDMCLVPQTGQPRVIPPSKIFLPPDEVVTQRKVHLDVTLEVEPLELCVCDYFNVTVNVTNWGNVDAENVVPTLIYNPPSGANNCTGPNPSSATIGENKTETFTFRCHCAAEGQLEIGVNVTGDMGCVCSGKPIPADNINLPGTVNITQYPPIELWCDGEPIPQRVCNAVNFTANATGGNGNFTYMWEFGDPICDPEDNVAFTQNASHTYMCTGNYTATVTVSDGICENRTCNVTVEIILEAPELISPPNGTMVITDGSGNVCFEWENIGCCNYTLQIWQKEEWGQKIWNINTGKNSTWCVPLMPDYYRWQVVATDICDEWVVSETWYFGVDMDIEYPYVDVTRPTGGETWAGGTNETITWFASEFTEFPVFGDGMGLNQEDLVITVFYSADGGDSWTSIPMDGVNDGACSWMVPMIDSSQCLIKVVATDAQGNPGNDVSGLFTIATDVTPPTVTVNDPDGGESWQGGTAHNILWTATDDVTPAANLTIDLYLWDGDTWSLIAAGQANDGTYAWTVPHINSDQCLVKVVATDAAGNVGEDSSDEVFSIESDEIYPDVTVDYPNGGEVFTGDSNVVITWEATKFQSPSGGMGTDQADLTIEIYFSSDGGAVWTAVPMDGVNDGAYLWTVPMVNSVLCLIRVDATDAFGNTGTDTSNGVFTIISEPSCPDSFNITLFEGWNLISLPLIPDNSKIDVVLADVSGPGSIMQVWAWDAQAESYLGYIPWVGGNLTDMQDGPGYWVSTNGTAILTINGTCMPTPPQSPPSYDVYTGWDLIGLKSVVARTTDDYLRTIAGQYGTIWAYDPDTQAYVLVYPSPPGTGMMWPGEGVWIWITSDGTIIPPGN